MITSRDLNVVRIPIAQINIVNPRTRGKHKFRQIVSNISTLGLKKPVTVVRRGERDGQPQYDLVCGQGRLEACHALGDTAVPALVIEASREDLLLMSLAENMARRRPTTIAMLREVGALRERGYTFAQIAEKTDLNMAYVKGIVRLLKHGETRLLNEVEHGRIPISIALIIATSNDQDIQRALADAYANNSLRGKELLRARRLIEQRRSGEGQGTAPGGAPEELTSSSLLQTYKRETAKQRVAVHKANLCDTRLRFVGTALKQLLADPAFVAILQSAGLDKLPQSLADLVGSKGQPT